MKELNWQEEKIQRALLSVVTHLGSADQVKWGFCASLEQASLKHSFFLRFYLFMRDTERERQRHRQREERAPCREPYVGLDPRFPGSCPGPKAGTQPLSHPGVPSSDFLYPYCLNSWQWVLSRVLSFGVNFSILSFCLEEKRKKRKQQQWKKNQNKREQKTRSLGMFCSAC